MSICGGQGMIISDPVYEECIRELIEAGNIMLRCTHGEVHPCELCQTTWKGVADNAKAVMRGKQILTNRHHE